MNSSQGSDDLNLFRATLRKGHRQARGTALRKLAELGPAAAPAVPELIAGLRDPDLELRAQAASVLARLGRASIGPLTEALHTPDPDLQKAILVTLTEMGPEAAPAALAVEALVEDAWLGPSAQLALRSTRRAHRPGFGMISPHLLLRAAAGLLLLAAVLVTCLWIGLVLELTPPQSAGIASLAIAFLSAALGVAVGRQTGDDRRMIFLTAAFAIGGAAAGAILGGLLTILVEPVARVLGGG